MGAKPKASQYAPSATERTQSRIAKADADYFAKTYDPLLVKMRDKAKSENVAATLRGRAGADTMQALTSTSSMPHSGDIDLAGDLATAATGQMLSANVAARQAKIKDQIGVLGTARGQRADTGSALAQAARLRASEDLTRIGVKQQVRSARRQAAFDAAGAIAGQGLQNYQQTGSPLKQHLGYIKDAQGKPVQQYGTGFFGGFKTGTQPLKMGQTAGIQLTPMQTTPSSSSIGTYPQQIFNRGTERWGRTGAKSNWWDSE